MKRVLDVLVSTCALVVLSPVLASVAIWIIVTMGRPVLFVQDRAGQHGQPFRILKFRTMARTVDAAGRPLPDVERITRVGQFLRSTSLDELPQFWNVLRGDMSLVGPRPLLVKYLDRYPAHHARRHDVRPGVTGWAQVNGRNATTWTERLDMDAWYVDNESLRLDLRILWRTVALLFTKPATSISAADVMQEYQG